MPTHPPRRRGFRALVPERTWNTLCQQGNERTYAPGQPIFVRGAPAATVLLLTAGRVEVGFAIREGDYRLLALRGTGDVIGELASDAGGIRTADVVALDECAAIELSADTFERLLAHDGSDRQVRRYVTAKLLHSSQAMVDMSALAPLPRIARLLLQLAELADPGRDCGVIPLSQTKIGYLLGLSRSRVSLLVNRLCDEGVLRIKPALTVEHFDLLRQHAYPKPV